ncbi:septum site determining protein [Corynebacterium poyangense]|uniref:Septum site determining protein n=1 Tax=Corynebacterium poyangense TaxID=2684405 RepID=A0A7H0SLM9_9CORY|nr:septum site-determining protein Ssd [Corynebacterium poyangense]MBZ8177555.1 septum site determining protein [Corynebacterium poyangense]QNQ89454.1 septum site determining protein [Corynebacterium poyangense]
MNSILVAVTDPTLHPEAVHIAAATGRNVIDTTDPREISRYFNKVDAVLVDETPARHVGSLPRRAGVYFLAADPGPMNWRSVVDSQAQHAFVIPAQATELLAELGRADLPQGGTGLAPGRSRGHVLAITGACGGAGASTLAVGCALRAAGTYEEPVTLVDGDVNSGGIDLLCGIEQEPGVRWPDINFGYGRLSAEELRRALPHTGSGVAVLSATRSTLAQEPELSAEVIAAALRDLSVGPGLSIVDLPGHMLFQAAEISEFSGVCDRLLMVVPAEIRAVSAAARRVNRLRTHGWNSPIEVVVRHRGWSGLDIGEIETILQCSVLGEVGTIPRMAKCAELQGLEGRRWKSFDNITRQIIAEPGRTA